MRNRCKQFLLIMLLAGVLKVLTELYEVSTIIMPILKSWKLSYRKVKWFGLGQLLSGIGRI